MCRFLPLVVLVIAGCDQRVDQLLEKLAGYETNTVVLVKGPTVVGSTGLILRSAQPMKVVGDSSSLCLVLKSGVSLGPQVVMNKLFEESLRGADVTALLRMKSGKTIRLSKPGQAWDKYGHVTSSEEQSACFSCACGVQPTVGDEVAEATVNSTPPIKILGIYWESTNAFDQLKGK
jgi:hypothetical protein